MVPKMSPDELTSVLTRLREMARSSSAATAPPPPPILPQPAPYPPPPAFSLPPAPASYALPSVPAAPAPSQYASLLQSLGLSNQAALPAAVPVAASPTVPLVNSTNLSALLSTLQGRFGSGAVAPSAALPEPKQPPTDPSKMTQQEYEDRMLSFKVGTTTSELLRYVPPIHECMD